MTGRKITASLAAIFILPVILARLVYIWHADFHLQTMNHGRLVTPAVSIPLLYQHLQGKGRWIMLQVYKKNCDGQCEKLDWYLGQIKKALGNNRQRVFVARENSANIKRINDADKISHPVLKFSAGIYLIDPRGFLFMRYDQNRQPIPLLMMAILKDMQRVLDISQIG